MSDLELLLNTIDNFCNSLERMAQNELKFCVETQMLIEKTSWDVQRSINDLKSVYEFYGC